MPSETIATPPYGVAPSGEIRLRPPVCTVVLNWNGPRDTLECLDSLWPLVESRQTTLIVCDNNSTDDSVDKIITWANAHFQPLSNEVTPDGDFLLIRNPENRGYGGGNNSALRIALQRPHCEYIWVLNNDCIVDAGALTALVDCAAGHEKIGLIGATLMDYIEREQVQCAGGCYYNPLTTIFKPVLAGKSLFDLSSIKQDPGRDYVSGASLFFRSEMLRQVGLFDEQFFLYYEELDMTQRLRAHGYQDLWCRCALVYHKGGASTESNAGGSWSSHYHENLSTLLFTRKHYPFLLPLASAFRFFGKSFIYLWRWKVYLFSALLSAYYTYFYRSQPILWNEKPEVLFVGATSSHTGLF